MSSSLACNQGSRRYFNEHSRRFVDTCCTNCFSPGLWLQTDNNVSSLLLNVYEHFVVLWCVNQNDNKQPEKFERNICIVIVVNVVAAPRRYCRIFEKKKNGRVNVTDVVTPANVESLIIRTNNVQFHFSSILQVEVICF